MRIALVLLCLVVMGCVQPPAEKKAAIKEPHWVSSSPYISEFSLPDGSKPTGIFAAEKIWVAEDGLNKIAGFDPSSEEVDEFELPLHDKGRAGALWDVRPFEGRIYYTLSLFSREEDVVGALDVQSGEVEEFRLGNASAPFIIATADGVWFTELYGGKIGRIKGGVMEEIDVPGEDLLLAGITVNGSDVWFTESFRGKLVRYSAVLAKFTEYETPFASPVGLAMAGSKVWMADHGASRFGYVDVESYSTQVYPTSPSDYYPTSLPNDIEIMKDGEVWMTEHTGNRIGRFDPTEEVLVEYLIPTKGPNVSDTLWLSVREDGKVWFTQWSGNEIGYVDPSVEIPFSVSLEKYDVEAKKGEVVKVGLAVSEFAQNLSFSASSSGSPTGKAGGILFDGKGVVIDTAGMEKGEYVIRVGMSDPYVSVSRFLRIRVQ